MKKSVIACDMPKCSNETKYVEGTLETAIPGSWRQFAVQELDENGEPLPDREEFILHACDRHVTVSVRLS